MSADNEDQAQDDILELCSMVEEYKECFQIAENENRELREQHQEALVEIERLRAVEIQQAGVIERLDDSVNQLVEEIEQNTQIMFTKDADLASLQHVLGVIHKRKVEVDDQTQLQQSRQIESLTAEKNKLGEAYSLNLKILEDYLTIINQKDSEILDLNHTIKQLELQIENFNNGIEESERKEELERLGAFTATQSPPTKSTNSTASSTGQPSPPVTASNTVHGNNSGSGSKNNNRPATAPAQKTLFTDNPARSAGTTERLAAARRTATSSTTTSNPAYQAVDSEYSSDDNNEEEPSPVLPVTISRNRSTRMMRNNSTSGAGGGSGSVGGSINSGNAGGVSGTGAGGSLHSVSMNNMRTVDTSSNKEAALSKYRRYVALNTTTTPTPTNSSMHNANTTNTTSSYASYNSVSNDDVDAESSYVDNGNTAIDTTHSTHNTSTSAGTGKWSDVGKHERLFDKVDIIKQPSSNNTTSTNTNTNTTGATRRKSQPTTKPIDYNIDNYTHPTLHTTPTNNYTNTNPSHTTHTTSTNNTHNSYTNSYDESDSVEVFVNTDSNPPSPERTKPNKLFKPPFSKPVFNEFTHNKVGKGKSSGSGGSGGESGSASSMWSKRTTSYAPDPDTTTSTSKTNTSITSGSAAKKSIRTSDNGESRI